MALSLLKRNRDDISSLRCCLRKKLLPNDCVLGFSRCAARPGAGYRAGGMDARMGTSGTAPRREAPPHVGKHDRLEPLSQDAAFAKGGGRSNRYLGWQQRNQLGGDRCEQAA